MSASAHEFFHLVYVSEAEDQLAYTDIEDILKSSKANNKLDSITGLLIHRDGFFIQLLESDSKEKVKQTLARIITDDRHCKLRVIGEWTSKNRLFHDWKMGFFDSDINDSEFPFIQKLFSSVMLASLPDSNEIVSLFKEILSSEVEIK